MRNHILITAGVLLAVSVIMLGLVFLATGNQEANITDHPEQVAIDPSGVSEEYEYLLKDFDGKLAVYLKNQEKPQKVFDVYISTLPEFDRGQLAQGVRVKDYSELVRCIEDYIS